jgi:hypothetical protein
MIVHLLPQVDTTRDGDELLAGFVLQLPPQWQRLHGHAHEAGIVVGEPEDPGSAVAGSPLVSHLELFEENDLPAPAG